MFDTAQEPSSKYLNRGALMIDVLRFESPSDLNQRAVQLRTPFLFCLSWTAKPEGS